MRGYSLDPSPLANVADKHFAVIYAPRRKRERFPQTCVTLVESEAEALAKADPDSNQYAAEVIGPARSSEGLNIFYVIQWLGEQG